MRNWFSSTKSKVEIWKNAGHRIMQNRKNEVNSAVVLGINPL